MLKTWQLWTQGSNPSEWSNMMLWQIYKRSSELSPICSGAPWNPAKVQQHLAPCASPHIPLLPCCTNPGVFPPSHILFNLGTTYFDQNSLGECFSDLAHKSPELQEEFLYNAETQVEAHPPHKLFWYFSHNTGNINHEMHFLGFDLSFWYFLLLDVRH